jgi:hypothetical protein
VYQQKTEKCWVRLQIIFNWKPESTTPINTFLHTKQYRSSYKRFPRSSWELKHNRITDKSSCNQKSDLQNQLTKTRVWHQAYLEAQQINNSTINDYLTPPLSVLQSYLPTATLAEFFKMSPMWSLWVVSTTLVYPDNN